MNAISANSSTDKNKQTKIEKNEKSEKLNLKVTCLKIPNLLKIYKIY
jgi:hypothetical protein